MLACVMSVSLFGCSSTSNSTAREAKDGTYTATAQGFEKGDVKVTITVKEIPAASQKDMVQMLRKVWQRKS